MNADKIVKRNIDSQLKKAIVLMIVAICFFDIMGAIIKYMGETYPVQQLSLLRNIFALIPTLLVLYFSRGWYSAGKPILIRQWKMALFRGGLIAMAQFFFYLSLTSMEFATASTLTFSGPLFVTVLSIPLLGHQVGLIRWFAVLLGFVGIILVMRPIGQVFNWTALLPLGAAFGYATNSVTAQLFDKTVPTATINLYTLAGSLIGSLILLYTTSEFVAIVSLEDWFWLLLMGVMGGTAVFCWVSAYRLTEPSNLSPFEYFGIPFTFTLGWLFFDETPFSILFPGVFLIIGGGLLIIWRERSIKAHEEEA